MTLNVPVVLKTGTKNSVTNYITNQLTNVPYLSSIECRVLNGSGTIIGTKTCYVNTVTQVALNNSYTPGTYLQLQGKTTALLPGVSIPVSGTVDFK